MWELSSGSSWNLLLRLEEILTMNLPSLLTFQHGGSLEKNSRREPGAGSPSHIPTPQRPADRHIPLGASGPDTVGFLVTLALQGLMGTSLQAQEQAAPGSLSLARILLPDTCRTSFSPRL